MYTLGLSHLLIIITICSVLYEFDAEQAFVSKRQVAFHQPSASGGTFAIFPMLRLFQHSYVWNLVLWCSHLWSKNSSHYLYIGSTLGSIYRKYAIVYCGYHWHLIICWWYCTCAIIGVKQAIHLSKMVRYLYKLILITQTTLSCMVKFKQTTVISNIKRIEFESL